MKTFRVNAKCKYCGGAGVYDGFAEEHGYGVVCRTCKGTGCQEIVVPYEDFNGRIERDDIHTVLECNPGIGVGGDRDFGGMPYQCQASNVPFFFKQWGQWQPFYDRDIDDPDWLNVPDDEKTGICRLNLEGGCGFHGDRVVYFKRVGKKDAGRLLDGRTWNEMPEAQP